MGQTIHVHRIRVSGYGGIGTLATYLTNITQFTTRHLRLVSPLITYPHYPVTAVSRGHRERFPGLQTLTRTHKGLISYAVSLNVSVLGYSLAKVIIRTRHRGRRDYLWENKLTYYGRAGLTTTL